MEQHNTLDCRNLNPEAAIQGCSVLNTLKISAVRLLLDDSLTLLWASDHFYHCAGYDQAGGQVPFSSLRQYYDGMPAAYAALQSKLALAVEQGASSLEHTGVFPRKGGPQIWVRWSGTVTPQAADGLSMADLVMTNIDDLMIKKEEQAHLHEQSTQYFKWMMDEYIGNIYLSDMDSYELLYLNKTACETLGLPPTQMLGRKCYEVIQGRTSPCPFCTNDRLSEDSFYQWEFYNPVLERTFMIKNRIINWNGHRTRIELSHDMYSAEYKLAKKDREREALLRTIPGGFARLDARDCRTILWYGAGFLSIIGYTKKQLENELHSQCAYLHPDDWPRTLALMKEIENTRKSAVFEARIITHNGEIRTLTKTLCYVSGEESWDGIPSFYSVSIDVTKERAEQKRQHKALEDAYQAARVASAAKTNFLSSMSHDIRTPMNAIMGMAAIAQANLTAPEKVQDCLKKINVSSRHLLSLINEVLDMSKIESGKIDLIPEEVSLPVLVENVADMCRPLIAEKQQEFQISVDKVRHEKIVADGDRLRQVFMNLLSNAIKYTPEGGVIRLIIRESPSILPNKGLYEFVFQDNGIGMSQEYISHIFEPFSRAEDSRISNIQGTGLGMAITENIVRMMNGTIDVKSKLGEGSQFTISVPLELQSEEEDCEEELNGLAVLVVDDDQIVCENATALLNELGMRGDWVLSGSEAIARVADAHSRAEDFFAVILDWKMPEMDGLETLKAIREKLGEEVPIIIISAYDYSDIEDEFLRAGADAFITKPLFKSKMLHVLQLFCSTNKTDAAHPTAPEPHALLSGKRVLLAEDNALNREIASELLKMQGICVDTAENGQQAVETFAASAPGTYALILMDIQMPVMDGYQATAAIRALKREDALPIPILALTANAFTSDVGKARSVGMNDHIAKPIDVDHLLEVLTRWIS